MRIIESNVPATGEVDDLLDEGRIKLIARRAPAEAVPNARDPEMLNATHHPSELPLRHTGARRCLADGCLAGSYELHEVEALPLSLTHPVHP